MYYAAFCPGKIFASLYVFLHFGHKHAPRQRFTMSKSPQCGRKLACFDSALATYPKREKGSRGGSPVPMPVNPSGGIGVCPWVSVLSVPRRGEQKCATCNSKYSLKKPPKPGLVSRSNQQHCVAMLDFPTPVFKTDRQRTRKRRLPQQQGKKNRK